MNMLEIHQHALEESQEAYHKFLLTYKKDKKCVYIFVEGKTDPSYYTNKISSIIPEGCDIDFWPAGNKKKVIKVFNCFDWSRFNRRQVIFFIDRDFSSYLPENLPLAVNVYVTESYSIENSLVCRSVCKQILQDLKGMENLNGVEMDRVLKLFDNELSRFHSKILPISAHLIAWRLNGAKPCADNIKMNDIFEFISGRLRRIAKPKGNSGVPSYLCKKFKLRRNGILNKIAVITNELKKEQFPKKYTRGKYELWFLLEFCEHIRENFKLFSSMITKQPKNICEISLKNALAIIGPRAPMPASLYSFLNDTVIKYATQALYKA
jgi:hypothetical protein